MKRAIWMTVVVLAAAVLFSGFAQAQGDGRGVGRKGAAVGNAGERRGPHGQGMKQLERNIGRLYLIAVKVAKETGDTQLKSLIAKSLDDNDKLLEARKVRSVAFRKLVDAMYGDDQAAIKAAHEAVKAASEAMHEIGEQCREDMKAIAARLKELRPQIEEEMKQRGRGEGRGRGPKADAPPELD